MNALRDLWLASLLASLAAGCGPQVGQTGPVTPGTPTTTPATPATPDEQEEEPVELPPSGHPNAGDDGRAIAQVPWEPGELPRIPGVTPLREQKRPAGAPRPGQLHASHSTLAMVIDGERLGHDPGVAVGETVVFSYIAHKYQLFDRATGQPLPDREGDEIPSAGDFNGLFSPLWAPRDRKGQPNAANVNTRLRFAQGDPLACNPEDPMKHRACVREFYDSRVLYDPVRKRFWVESAARNHLWFCKKSDKEPCNKEEHTQTQARRYIAVAVSRTEDPRQGFHRYILVDEYADWPKMALHDRYLVLGHRATTNVYVFDADKLAAGNPDGGPVRVAKLNASSFPGVKWLVPVDHKSPAGPMTYLLGTSGTEKVVPFALMNPDPNRAAPPVVIKGPSVSIGEEISIPDNNAVWNNGMLHVAWDPCKARSGACQYREVHMLRLPLQPQPGKPDIWAGDDPARGFLRLAIGGREPDDGPDDVLDYEKPVLDVNRRGDVVIAYARKGYQTRAEVLPEVRYSILYAGESKARPGVLVRKGTWPGLPDIDDNVHAGIDLAGAQTDPVDGITVWFSHAYAEKNVRWFRQVTAAVKP